MIEHLGEAVICKAKRAYVSHPFWSLKNRSSYAELYLTEDMLKQMDVIGKPFWMWSMSYNSPLGSIDPGHPEYIVDLTLSSKEYFATKSADKRNNLLRVIRKGDSKFKLSVLDDSEYDEALLAFVDRNYSKKYFWLNGYVEDYNVLFEEYNASFQSLNSRRFWKWKLTSEGKPVGIAYLYKSKLNRKEVRDCCFVWNYNFKPWYPGIYSALKLREVLSSEGFETYNMCTGNYSYKNDIKTGVLPSKQYVQFDSEYAEKYGLKEVDKWLP